MENNTPTLYQPNVITHARYSFNEYEMRVLIYVVKRIQDKLNREGVQFNETLFGEMDYKLFFYLSDLLEDGEKNHVHVRKALKSLRQRSFEVDNEKEWFEVGFVNYGGYNKDAKKWELQVSHKLMPYMISIAKGFTTFQLETVLNLNSHSQRLYMMFSQFHDTGVFKITAEDLRFKLGLENSYKRFLDFKTAVITRSLKEIKALYDIEKADLWVKLESDKKVRGKDDFDRLLVFKIFYSARKTEQNDKAKAETLRYCTMILKSIYGENPKFGNTLLGYCTEKKHLLALSKKLEGIEDKAEKEGKPLSAYGGLVRHIASEDFGFKG